MRANRPRPCPAVEGVHEGESLQVLDKTGGVAEVQTAVPLGWSDDRQLWWRDCYPKPR